MVNLILLFFLVVHNPVPVLSSVYKENNKQMTNDPPTPQKGKILLVTQWNGNPNSGLQFRIQSAVHHVPSPHRWPTGTDRSSTASTPFLPHSPPHRHTKATEVLWQHKNPKRIENKFKHFSLRAKCSPLLSAARSEERHLPCAAPT